MLQVDQIHNHHVTCLLIFLSQSWYARDRTMPTMGHPSQRHTTHFKYCGKVLSMKNISINIKTNKCTPISVLRWEFASVYIYI